MSHVSFHDKFLNFNMKEESLDSHDMKANSDDNSDLQMLVVEDQNSFIILSQSLLASILEIMSSVECIEKYQEIFMEIGCYFARVSPVIMELQRLKNTPPNATEVLQSLSESVDLAKYVVGQCRTGVHSVPHLDIRSIIEQLESVIRNIGKDLSSLPSSTFKDHDYAKVAVQSLSKEMKNAHFEISQIQVLEQNLEILEWKELQEGELASMETDLYPIHMESSNENPQSLDLLQWVEYMEPLPETFLCPLTKKIMDEPTTIESGMTYERKVIEEWFKKFEQGSEDVICPTTGRRIASRVLNTNVALKATIEAWKERNETERIKVARAALSLASSGIMILEALKDLQNLCQRKQYNKVHMRNIGIIPLLTQLLDHEEREVRCATLETLRLLAEEDDEGKETIAETKIITTAIQMLSSNHLTVRHASLSLLQELSMLEPLCEKIGSVSGGILMLITMKYSQSLDAFSAEKAYNILKNLERSPKNIKCMAENGFLEPLLNHLIEGSEEMQMEMGEYLGEIVLGSDNKTHVAERASPALIKMVHSGNTITRKAAFKALVQISSYHPNSTTLVESGIVSVMIEEMFTRRIYDEPMNSKEESAAILANILDSGISFETLKVNSHGHTMASDYIVYNLIHMIKSSIPDELNINLIKILLSLTKSPKSTAIVVSMVKETQASYTLIRLLNSRHEELEIAAIKLLIKLTPYLGHTLVDILCKTKGQPENLIRCPTETNRITEKHAVSANFLAKLPHQNLTLNLALLYKDTAPKIIQTINDIQRSGTRTSRFANSYLEGLVGILVRFTTTLYEHQVLFLARNQNLTAVFTELLMRTASDEVQRLSAIGLENLSAESINLSKPPQIKRPKFMRLFYLPRFLCFGSSKYRRLQVCPIHRGACSSQYTFCLLDAKAVERLLGCLDHENVEVVEAALSAICTLLDDKVDVDKSVDVLSGVNAIQHVLNLLREHKQESVWQKSFWVIEKFLMKGGDRSASDISQDRLLPSTLVTAFHHGNGNTKLMAEKLLRHLNKMPNYSSKIL